MRVNVRDPVRRTNLACLRSLRLGLTGQAGRQAGRQAGTPARTAEHLRTHARTHARLQRCRGGASSYLSLYRLWALSNVHVWIVFRTRRSVRSPAADRDFAVLPLRRRGLASRSVRPTRG